jgi:CHAT domain-containing protein
MIDFHRRLRMARSGSSGFAKAEALRQAALMRLRSNEYRHPFYWAGFVLVGDGR